MDKETARDVHALLIQAAGAIDAAIATAQSGMQDSELVDYKHAAGNVLDTLMEEMLKPIYREHPDLIPPELDREFLRL